MSDVYSRNDKKSSINTNYSLNGKMLEAPDIIERQDRKGLKPI